MVEDDEQEKYDCEGDWSIGNAKINIIFAAETVPGKHHDNKEDVEIRNSQVYLVTNFYIVGFHYILWEG